MCPLMQHPNAVHSLTVRICVDSLLCNCCHCCVDCCLLGPLGPLTRLDPPTGTGARLEVFAANSWSSVCQRRSMDDITATITCRQFNFSFGRSSSWTNDGSPWLPINLADVACKGDEVLLEECSWQAALKKVCDHSFDATVDCSNGGCYDCHVATG